MCKVNLFLLLSVVFTACSQPQKEVNISGNIVNGDSIISLRFADSVYNFKLNESNYFEGTIKVDDDGYAKVLNNSFDIYLSPATLLELNYNNANFSATLEFGGTLGAINNYLKEQELSVFFDNAWYDLEESEFIDKMTQIAEEKIQLLQAKNFDESFTKLEKLRIRYSIASLVALYPLNKRKSGKDPDYIAGPKFRKFLSAYSLKEEKLLGTSEYRDFLFNYARLKGNDEALGVVEYIASTIANTNIRNFLLAEFLQKHIYENNGPENSGDLIMIFEKVCRDTVKLNYIRNVISQWNKIKNGEQAPVFELENINGEKVNIESYRGYYVYITVWASWCLPCKHELSYLNSLAEKYKGKDIRFITISVDNENSKEEWKNVILNNSIVGEHLIVDNRNRFSKDYMIVSVPRFILLDKEGKIISANAPRPSGPIISLLDELNM